MRLWLRLLRLLWLHYARVGHSSRTHRLRVNIRPLLLLLHLIGPVLSRLITIHLTRLVHRIGLLLALLLLHHIRVHRLLLLWMRLLLLLLHVRRIGLMRRHRVGVVNAVFGRLIRLHLWIHNLMRLWLRWIRNHVWELCMLLLLLLLHLRRHAVMGMSHLGRLRSHCLLAHWLLLHHHWWTLLYNRVLLDHVRRWCLWWVRYVWRWWLLLISY